MLRLISTLRGILRAGVILHNKMSLSHNFVFSLKADFQLVEYSERAEIPLFTGENVALKLNR